MDEGQELYDRLQSRLKPRATKHYVWPATPRFNDQYRKFVLGEWTMPRPIRKLRQSWRTSLWWWLRKRAYIKYQRYDRRYICST